MTESTNNVGAGLMWLTFGNEALQAVQSCRWQIALCAIMLFVDLWWAYSENRFHYYNATTEEEKKKYEWHMSRAVRRSCIKFVDYLTFLLVGVVLGLAVTEPYHIATHQDTAIFGILIGVSCDTVSSFGHFCVVRGWSFSHKDVWAFIKRFFVILVKKKNEDIGDALEETMKETKEE